MTSYFVLLPTWIPSVEASKLFFFKYHSMIWLKTVLSFLLLDFEKSVVKIWGEKQNSEILVSLPNNFI